VIRNPIEPPMNRFETSGARGRAWAVAHLLAISFYLWSLDNVPLVAYPEAGHDDGLFVTLAGHILNGEWLGPYNNLTLAKGPFYSLWIAADWIVGLPLLVSQGALYAAGCLLLTRGLRPWLRREAFAFGVFVVLLFDPITYTHGQLRVLRDGIYLPLTVLLLAAVVWWFRGRDRSFARRAATAVGLGLVLAAFWCTREEGVWILPVLSLCLVLAMFLAVRERGPRAGLPREALIAGIAAATAFIGVGAVAGANYARYGVFDVVEFKQAEFLSAYGAFARVRHRGFTPYVVIPRETLDRVLDVGPAAAELRPAFGGPTADVFSRAGCDAHKVSPCDGEYRGGWFMWMLREAAAAAGHHSSATEARAYYARLGEEVNAACADGRLDCLPPRRTMLPPFRWDSVWPTIRTAGELLWFVATYETVDAAREPMSCLQDDCGHLPRYTSFLDLTRTSLFVKAPWVSSEEFPRRSGPEAPTFQRSRAAVVADLLERVVGVYRGSTPWALAAGVLAYAFALVAGLVRRRVDPMLAVATAAAATAASRITLIAFLDVVSMPGRSSFYLSPAYPALLLFCLASLAAAVWSLRPDRLEK